MSTYRERRERKAERLREWAEKRDARAEQASETAHQAVAGIPFGQPILKGHHSQHRHERAVERSWDAMGRAVENGRKADEFRSRADNIEAAAERAIYSDDPDVIERLRERVAELEAKRETMKARNAEFRKARRGELRAMSAFERDRAMPHPGYELTNLGGSIGRNRKRLAALEAERPALEPVPTCACGQLLVGDDGRQECASCAEPDERHESMRLFAPAPAPIPGQLQLGE